MEASTILISVAAIKSGDTLLGPSGPAWTAISDATTDPDESVACLVRHPDGGRELRVWDSSEISITVAR